MADIFISYASEDRETTKTLAQALADQGWSVWWDRNIPSGQLFHEVIERELTAARCVIALWSTAALGSPWVREEAQDGLDRKILVPARIETVRPPIGFRTVQTADLRDWKGKPTHPGFMRLVEDIRAVLGTHERGKAPFPPPVPGQAKKRRPYFALLALIGVIMAVGLGYALLKLGDYEWRHPTPSSVSKPPDESVLKPADQPAPQPADKPVAPPFSVPPPPDVSPASPEANKALEKPIQTQPGETTPLSTHNPLPIAPQGPTKNKPVQKPPRIPPERYTNNPLCGEILHRLQLGETLSEEDSKYLKECRPIRK